MKKFMTAFVLTGLLAVPALAQTTAQTTPVSPTAPC